MITLQSRPDSIVIFPSGHLDLNASFELRQIIGQVLEPEVNLTLDLHRVDSVDADGLSALVDSARRVRAIGAGSITHSPPS